MTQLDTVLSVLSRTQFPLRPVEAGKIKIGGLGEERVSRKGTTWRLPRRDSYFTVTTLERTAKGDLVTDKAVMTELLKDYGEMDEDGERRLRQIPIRLLSDDIGDVLRAQFCWYGRKKCGARSDGRKVTWFYDPATFERYSPPKVEDWRDELLEMRNESGDRLFGLHSTFRCVIACRTARWGGDYVFRTKSQISFRQIMASLLRVQKLTCGVLMGVPLRLVVRPMHVTPTVRGKEVGTTVHVVHVDLLGEDLTAIQRIAAEQAKQRIEYSSEVKAMQSRYRSLILEDDEDEALVQQEFHPDTRLLDEETLANVGKHLADSEADEPAPDGEAETVQEEQEEDAPKTKEDFLRLVNSASIPLELDGALTMAAKVLDSTSMTEVLKAATERRAEVGE